MKLQSNVTGFLKVCFVFMMMISLVGSTAPISVRADEEDNDTEEHHQPTCTLTANPSTITAGPETTTLTLHLTHAESATIDNGVGTLEDGETATVSPDVTTTYTATVHFGDDEEEHQDEHEDDNEGKTVTCSVVVTVTTPPADSCVVVSDTVTQEGGDNAVLVSFIHSAWNAVSTALSNAKWIWGEDPVSPSDTQKTETFTRTFSLTSVPTSATLEVSADNGFIVKVNGKQVDDRSTIETNYQSVQSYNVASLLTAGTNTLEFTVTTFAQSGGTPQSNPAGLIYRLTTQGAKCGTPPVTEAPTCDAQKELLKNGGFESPAISTTDWDIVPSGTTGLEWLISWINPTGAPTIANAEFHKNVNGWLPASGAQYAELDSDWNGHAAGPNGEAGAVTMAQTVATIPGKTYTFSFKFSPRPDQGAAENKVEALANGTVIGTTAAVAGNGTNTNWKTYSFSYVATGNTTTFALRDAAGNPNNSVGSFVDDASVKCVPKEEPKPITVVASKVVCDKEYDLPNWGNGGSPITADTAANWVATHASCHLVDGWNFQYGDHTAGDAGNTFVGEASGYTTFGPTVNGVASVSIPMSALGTGTELHLREVLKNGFIPFTFNNNTESPNGDSVSAEFYCSNDVLNYDNWDFIRNPEAGKTYYCVAFNAPKEPEVTTTERTIVVRLADLFSGSILTGLTSGKWFEYNDTNDVIDNTLGAFVNGPLTAPLGVGSIQFTLGANPNDRKNIATYQFAGTKLADITSLQFSAHSTSGIAGPTESPYLVMNTSFTGADSWQKRLVYVPGNNGAVPQDTWNTYDTINGGAGKWVYSGATWPVGVGETGTTPGTTAKTWTQILGTYPNAKILPTGGLLGVRVGEPGPTGYTGSVDKFVIGIKTGSNIDTKTYDFEPTKVAPKNGTLIIVKKTTGGDDSFDYDITGGDSSYDADVSTEDGRGETEVSLPAGTYDLSETVLNPWTLDSVSCEYDEESAGTAIANGERIYVAPGETITCTFHNTKKTTITGGPTDEGNPPSNTRRSGSRSGGGGGQVLGASTCKPLLTSFLKKGWKNDPEEVKKLQEFLNTNLGLTLTVSGVFDQATHDAVKAFQKKYADSVLKPWFSLPGSGIKNENTPTGFVYQTTRWQINNLFCQDSEQFPTVLN